MPDVLPGPKFAGGRGDALPVALSKINGKLHKARDDIEEDHPLESLRPPEYLSETANELWNYLVQRLAHIGLIAEPDRVALEALCETYSFWCLAAQDVRELGSGRYYEDSKGNLKLHPSIVYWEKMDARLRSWLNEFGLSPSARARWRGNMPMQELVDDEGLVIDGESLEELSPAERSAMRELLERHERSKGSSM